MAPVSTFWAIATAKPLSSHFTLSNNVWTWNYTYWLMITLQLLVNAKLQSSIIYIYIYNQSIIIDLIILYCLNFWGLTILHVIILNIIKFRFYSSVFYFWGLITLHFIFSLNGRMYAKSLVAQLLPPRVYNWDSRVQNPYPPTIK